jgi:LmbE family N-acetylglucosaminyl deacetylase
MTKRRSIIVFCAHPDDEVIGPGGTLLKYNKENIDTYVVIFSGGEMSNSLYERKKLINLRSKESKKAGKILKIKKIINLNLKDMNLISELKKTENCDKVKSIINKIKPEKIFTHSVDDMLYIDHKAVHNCIFKIVSELNKKGNKYSLYTFNVWTLNIRKRNSPKLIINIDNEFKEKIRALKEFKSQKLALLQLKPAVYLRALITGWKNNCRYAEEFYKVI